jgi:hypothetical protein
MKSVQLRHEAAAVHLLVKLVQHHLEARHLEAHHLEARHLEPRHLEAHPEARPEARPEAHPEGHLEDPEGAQDLKIPFLYVEPLWGSLNNFLTKEKKPVNKLSASTN